MCHPHYITVRLYMIKMIYAVDVDIDYLAQVQWNFIKTIVPPGGGGGRWVWLG